TRLLLVEALLADRGPAVDDAQLRAGLVDPPLRAPLAHAQLAPAVVGAQLGPPVTGTDRGPARVIADVVTQPVALRLGAPSRDLAGIVVEATGPAHVIAQPPLGPGLLPVGGQRARRLRPDPVLSVLAGVAILAGVPRLALIPIAVPL